MLLAAFALITATPASLPAALAAAKGGDRIRLAAGAYGDVNVSGRTYRPPLVIDAGGGAKLSSFNVVGSTGVTLTGGTLSGGNERGYTALVRQSRNVRIEKALMTNAGRGLVIDRSQDVAVVRNTFKELTIDGLDIALSRRVLVEGNECSSYSTGKAHPDCYQAWSRPEGITSDVIVRNNKATGNVQGITFFNHTDRGKSATSPGIDDGGFDRITITGNTIRILYPQGISASDVRGLTVKNNDVQSLPGARFKTAVNTSRSTGAVCNNRVPDVARSPAAAPCTGPR